MPATTTTTSNTTSNNNDGTSSRNDGNTQQQICNPDILAVRNYITGADVRNFANLDKDIVVIDLTHSNLQQRHIEIRFYKHNTINDLRTIIYRKTGTVPHHQQLQVFDIDHITLLTTILPNMYDTYKLGYFNILYHGMKIHCIDTNEYSISSNGGLENVALVPKFKLSDDQYDVKTTNTVRSWARNQKSIDPTFTYKKHAQYHNQLIEATRLWKQGLPIPSGFVYDTETEKIIRIPNTNTSNNDDETQLLQSTYGIESVQHVQINKRCQISPGGRRGTVAFIGTVQNNALPAGYWVGIVLDEPVGKNNGSIGTVHYFDTPGDNYGSFVRGPNVTIGNFPERNVFDSDDDEL